MKIAVQGAFDIGFSLCYSDDLLKVLFQENDRNISIIEIEGDYKNTSEKASFGLSLKSGYGIEIDISETEIEKVWDAEARRLAFKLDTFTDEFDNDEKEVLEMRKIWPGIVNEKCRIILFSSGYCEIEKVMDITDDCSPGIPISILHCYEYSGYGSYFESINNFPEIVYAFLINKINENIKLRQTHGVFRRKNKEITEIEKIRNLTTRDVGKKTEFIKTFTLFVFTTNDEIINNIYNDRIVKKKDEPVDYKKIVYEMDDMYISWYIQLISIHEHAGYKVIENFLLYYRIFDSVINTIDITDAISARLSKELTNGSYLKNGKARFDDENTRYLRSYLNHLYSSSKIYSITKNQELIEIFNFITSKINFDISKNIAHDEMKELDNHIDDHIAIRERKNSTRFTIIGVIFSGASIISLIIEILKIMDIIPR
jgi:hypothetical protein